MQTDLASTLNARHRLCNCYTSDGWSPFGKPLKCYKSEVVAMYEAARQVDVRAEACRVGCGHWHIYSRVYLLRASLLREIKRLGEQRALEILEKEV